MTEQPVFMSAGGQPPARKDGWLPTTIEPGRFEQNIPFHPNKDSSAVAVALACSLPEGWSVVLLDGQAVFRFDRTPAAALQWSRYEQRVRLLPEMEGWKRESILEFWFNAGAVLANERRVRQRGQRTAPVQGAAGKVRGSE